MMFLLNTMPLFFIHIILFLKYMGISAGVTAAYKIAKRGYFFFLQQVKNCYPLCFMKANKDYV